MNRNFSGSQTHRMFLSDDSQPGPCGSLPCASQNSPSSPFQSFCLTSNNLSQNVAYDPFEAAMSQRDRLVSLNNDLKQSPHHANAEAHLVRVERNTLTEMSKALKEESIELNAAKHSLHKTFNGVTTIYDNRKRKKSSAIFSHST